MRWTKADELLVLGYVYLHYRGHVSIYYAVNELSQLLFVRSKSSIYAKFQRLRYLAS